MLGKVSSDTLTWSAGSDKGSLIMREASGYSIREDEGTRI
jgi:hypothetical protein